MARLLRVHFASIGHADARLAPLTLDFRARAGSGTGTDTILWLRNGGGKSTILNLFYSVFRPDKREFLGASAEGRARNLEDYVKADDLAFVVTEWDVDPEGEAVLFARPPTKRRVVGQVLSWRDRQRSSDSSKLRRRFFSFVADGEGSFDDLPIDGLGADPIRSFDGFREWLDDLRQANPALETYYEETARRWVEHLERIGLDPELFRYQLKMNAREGSADEAFRFRTTDEFVRFYLDIAFDSAEADQVSANLQGFRDNLSRLPALRAEQSFLIDARARLASLLEAVAAESVAARAYEDQRSAAAALARALNARVEALEGVAARAEADAQRAEAAAKAESNNADRLGRWAKGLERRALELAVTEAVAARAEAASALEVAEERVAVAEAAVARDRRLGVQARRDAKQAALRAAEAEQEPLRRRVARAGTTARARLAEAIELAKGLASQHRDAEAGARTLRDRADGELRALGSEDAMIGLAILHIDEWLADRDRERERLRRQGLLTFREEVASAIERWTASELSERQRAAEQAGARDQALARAAAHDAAAAEAARAVASLDVAMALQAPILEGAVKERARIQQTAILRELDGSDVPDLEAPGVVDRLLALAEATQRSVLVAAVEGADDERALKALAETGRLPPSADVEKVLATLQASPVPAWSATAYLVENVPDVEQRARLIAGDPAARHGIVVPDAAALSAAQAYLETSTPRMSVVLTTASLEAAPASVDRLVLPGHPAHWDPRAGAQLLDQLEERRRTRQSHQEARLARERAARDAARDVGAWRGAWGEGRLAIAESDQEQRRATRERREADRLDLQRQAATERDGAERAESARRAAEKHAETAQRNARELQQFMERTEALVESKRDQRAQGAARRIAIVAELAGATARRDESEARALGARDAAKGAESLAEALAGERDAIDLFDDESADPLDLARARADWHELSQAWRQVVSENRLQWELDQLESELRGALAEERKRATGRESSVEAVPAGDGQRALDTGRPLLDRASSADVEARVREERAQSDLRAAGDRRRDAEDLPADEAPPMTAAEARDRAVRWRHEREQATERARVEGERQAHQKDRLSSALQSKALAAGHSQRLIDSVGEVGPGPGADLPELPMALSALVSGRVGALTDAKRVLEAAKQAAGTRGEALREVALSSQHEEHRSRVKERLKAPASDLAGASHQLHGDVEARLSVVQSDIADIDRDRRLVLQQLEKVAMDGINLLRGVDAASRLPGGLGAWDGESFLRIRAEVPRTQPERQARLEPMLDRAVAKAEVPAGRELVHLAVRELAAHRIEVTLLKPDATLRRDRVPVTEMQTFSRGQQLTVAILLYCTMARVRAQQRGRAHRPDAGVLLLDNPVGTCSSVPLLNLQHEVARQMRVQLVYTTGVNDPNAVATFPNTVRLRNAHRARVSGDLHVTIGAGAEDERGVEAIRVVAKP